MIFPSPQLSQFFVTGINYKKTDASLRSEFALLPEAYHRLLEAAPEYGISACFVISTCNRTEIYGLASEATQLSQLLCAHSAGNQHTFQLISYTRQGAEAADHLFRVAAGLDSQILGDYEIVGQLKTAVAIAKKYHRLDAFTERLVNEVLQCGKAIRTQTKLSGGTVSVAFAAIQFIKAACTGKAPLNIAVVGTGKMGRSTCKNLIDYTPHRNIVLINRNVATAQQLAAEFGVQSLSLDQLEAGVKRADVVIVSTAASEPVVLADMVNDGKERILIDLSVPNNIALDTALLPNIKLINVDTLSQQKDATLELRKAEVPRAEQLISAHLTAFLQWVAHRRYVPVLNAAKEKMMAMQNGLFSSQAIIPQTNMDPQGIQRILKHMAVEMQQQPEPGCNYLHALSRFIHQRFSQADAASY